MQPGRIFGTIPCVAQSCATEWAFPGGQFPPSLRDGRSLCRRPLSRSACSALVLGTRAIGNAVFQGPRFVFIGSFGRAVARTPCF